MNEKWPRNYRRLVKHMAETITAGRDGTAKTDLNVIAIAADVTAETLRLTYPNPEQRLAALDVYLTRLGNVMDMDGKREIN